jgi:4-amino-4-deoxy-L-arabinose transferase-like glycosyltransferase
VGNHAALFFATTPLTFALASIGVFDMLYTAFLFGAIGSLLVASATRHRRLEYVGWPLLALAVMTKGPVAILLVVLFGIALTVRRDTRSLIAGLHWELGLLFVALIASPLFLMTFTFGQRFVRDHLLAGNLYYSRNRRRSHPVESDLFFMRAAIWAGASWSILLVAAAIDAVADTARRFSVERALWIWIGVVLVFSIAGFKLRRIIFPAACDRPDSRFRLQTEAETVLPKTTAVVLWSVAAAFVAGTLLWTTTFRLDLEFVVAGDPAAVCPHRRRARTRLGTPPARTAARSSARSRSW